MELSKIKGSTYYIQAPTNIGVYVFKNKYCLLVDSGDNNNQAKHIDEILVAAGLHPKYIFNTHGHTDHCGGNSYFRASYPGCLVYASESDKIYMENPELLATVLYSANPLPGLEHERSSQPIRVDFVTEAGTVKINDEKFVVISLPGHTNGQLGIITPEKVCFVGDSIFSRTIITKYSIPYTFNIAESFRTLKYLRTVEADFFVLSHSTEVIDRTELLALVELNLANQEKFRNQLLELLNQPMTREDLTENISVLNDLQLSLMEYHLIFAIVSSYLTDLYESGLLDYSISEGKFYYFKKAK